MLQMEKHSIISEYRALMASLKTSCFLHYLISFAIFMVKVIIEIYRIQIDFHSFSLVIMQTMFIFCFRSFYYQLARCFHFQSFDLIFQVLNLKKELSRHLSSPIQPYQQQNLQNTRNTSLQGLIHQLFGLRLFPIQQSQRVIYSRQYLMAYHFYFKPLETYLSQYCQKVRLFALILVILMLNLKREMVINPLGIFFLITLYSKKVIMNLDLMELYQIKGQLLS